MRGAGRLKHFGLEVLFRTTSRRVWRGLLSDWARRVAATREPKEALVELIGMADELASLVDRVATPYDGGVHVKHRLIRYHDFFVDRVRRGERVLDVGCGKGELAHDLAVRAEAEVHGIDLNRDYLAFATRRFDHPRVTFIEADALSWRPTRPFDVVILSNVLEHIEPRIDLLVRLREEARPRAFLIRVPLLERDWLVPLRRELGLPYFSDATHETEYTEDGFRQEMQAAGLHVTHLQLNWGEIWAEVVPADDAGRPRAM